MACKACWWGVGLGVRLSVGWSVKPTPHQSSAPLYKGVSEDSGGVLGVCVKTSDFQQPFFSGKRSVYAISNII